MVFGYITGNLDWYCCPTSRQHEQCKSRLRSWFGWYGPVKPPTAFVKLALQYYFSVLPTVWYISVSMSLKCVIDKFHFTPISKLLHSDRMIFILTSSWILRGIYFWRLSFFGGPPRYMTNRSRRSHNPSCASKLLLRAMWMVVCCTSFIGGLNYHIEHHLFPRIHHMNAVK